MKVDVVIENEAGEIIGVEVKASTRVGTNDFKGLRALAQTTGRKFRRGIILYAGSDSVPFGDEFYTVPVQTIWR